MNKEKINIISPDIMSDIISDGMKNFGKYCGKD